MIEVKHLTKIYKIGKNKFLKAVDSVSFQIEQGEILALVGESGSGKSTLGRMILGLIPPTEGEIWFKGEKKTALLPQSMQMVFQDPSSSLNPRMTVEAILSEPTTIHDLPNRTDELLDLVGLPSHAKKRYPHEFSGGQKQRVAIARALALNPELLICDEPISALDVSIQAQIVNLLLRLQKEFDLTLLFITHDLRMARYISTHIAVMHHGKIIELEKTEIILAHPRHSYTQSLFEHFFLSKKLHNTLITV